MMSLRDAQRHHVLEVLQAVRGNTGEAAQILKISIADLRDLLADSNASEPA